MDCKINEYKDIMHKRRRGMLYNLCIDLRNDVLYNKEKRGKRLCVIEPLRFVIKTP